jgi:hypothetical protein
MIFFGKPFSTFPDHAQAQTKIACDPEMSTKAVRTEARIVRTGLRLAGGNRQLGSQAGP